MFWVDRIVKASRSGYKDRALYFFFIYGWDVAAHLHSAPPVSPHSGAPTQLCAPFKKSLAPINKKRLSILAPHLNSCWLSINCLNNCNEKLVPHMNLWGQKSRSGAKHFLVYQILTACFYLMCYVCVCVLVVFGC